MTDIKVDKSKQFRRFTPEEDLFLKENYPKFGLNYCCVKLNRHKGSVTKRTMLLQTGTFRKKQNNLKNFINIDQPEKAYFLGFLWADGHVPARNKTYTDNRIILGIQERDGLSLKDIFIKYVDFRISLHHKSNPRWKNILCFRVNDKEFHAYLISLDYHIKSGASPKKVLEKIPENLKHYFWRGLFDGDGHIGFYNNCSKTVSISSTYDQNWDCSEELCKKLKIIDYKIIRKINKKGHKGSEFKTNNFNDIQKFCEYIYKDFEVDQIGLKRKYNIFQTIKNKYENYWVKINKNNKFNIYYKIKNIIINIKNIVDINTCKKIKTVLEDVFI